jgi:hypothetical protein
MHALPSLTNARPPLPDECTPSPPFMSWDFPRGRRNVHNQNTTTCCPHDVTDDRASHTCLSRPERFCHRSQKDLFFGDASESSAPPRRISVFNFGEPMPSAAIPSEKPQGSFSMRPKSAQIRGGGHVPADPNGNVRFEGSDMNKSSLSARRPTSARSHGHSPSMFLDNWPTDSEVGAKTPASGHGSSMSGSKLALELMMSMKRGIYTSSPPQTPQLAMITPPAISVSHAPTPRSSAVRGEFTITAGNLPPRPADDVRNSAPKPTKPHHKPDASPRIAKMRPAQISLDQLQ